jgi:DNA-binding XRE family transcriptional regulator
VGRKVHRGFESLPLRYCPLGVPQSANASRVESHELFARNLRAQRTRQQMTQEDLAYASKVHPSEISRLECAERDPRLSTIVRVARGLDVSASELLRGIR